MGFLKKVESYYKENNRKYGYGAPENLWAKPERQTKRFEQFVKIFDFNNQSILDIGCGYGDFYPWLLGQGIFPSSYLGVDLLEEHCSMARSILPSDALIICGDILKEGLNPQEFCILSGTLNFYSDGWLETTTQILDRAWELATVAIAFNIRSPHSLNESYTDLLLQKKEMSPMLWCEYAHNKTSKYALFHNYVNFDYTIAMWKN